MSTKIKLSLLVTAVILCVTSTAFADKLCLQTTVNKKTFKVTNKSVVAAKCPTGYTAIADTTSFKGPAGADGANVSSRCVKKENRATGVGAFTVSVACAVDEYITSTACGADGVGAIGSTLIGTGDNSVLGSNVYGMLMCFAYDLTYGGTTPYTALAQAQCCKGT
jgi:hypothetical protein